MLTASLLLGDVFDHVEEEQNYGKRYVLFNSKTVNFCGAVFYWNKDFVQYDCLLSVSEFYTIKTALN